MKTIISLAAATVLLFGSCKKGELEDIKPMNPTTSQVQEEGKLGPIAAEQQPVQEEFDNDNGNTGSQTNY